MSPRRSLLGLLVIATACSGDWTAPRDVGSGGGKPQTPSTVNFSLDGKTCQGTYVLDYYIDDVLVGSWQTTAGGGATPATPLTPGTHRFRAELSDDSAIWGPATMSVPPLTAMTIQLTCTWEVHVLGGASPAIAP